MKCVVVVVGFLISMAGCATGDAAEPNSKVIAHSSEIAHSGDMEGSDLNAEVEFSTDTSVSYSSEPNDVDDATATEGSSLVCRPPARDVCSSTADCRDQCGGKGVCSQGCCFCRR